MRRIGVVMGFLVLGLGAAAPGPAAADPGGPAAGIAQRDSADAVRLAQRALQAGGYYRGDIDGQFGPETLAAVRYYQQSNRLPMTGRLDHRTLAALTLPMGDPLPSYGSAGIDQISDAGGR
jgi:peptidoglycan hydrolase-like protein with peptidoglycan-binding domain